MWPSQARILEISKRISGRIDASECECVPFLGLQNTLESVFCLPIFCLFARFPGFLVSDGTRARPRLRTQVAQVAFHPAFPASPGLMSGSCCCCLGLVGPRHDLHPSSRTVGIKG